MERNFRKSEFERFVQENADQYRMFPSEKVWNNLHKSLHKKRRWQGLGLAFLLLLTGTAVTFVMRSYPVVKGNLMVVDNTSGLQQFEDPKEEMPAPTDLRDITPFNETTKNIQAHIRQQLTPQPDGINQLQVAAKTESFIKDTKESRRDLMASINASLPELRHSAIVVNMDEY